MSSDPQLSRRRVIVGVAWATPAVLVATSSPPAAASDGTGPVCTDADLTETIAVVPTLAWTASGGLDSHAVGARTTGWLPKVAWGDTSPSAQYYANETWGFGGSTGFVSMDDNAATTADAVVRVRLAFQARAGVAYAVAFDMTTGYGNHNLDRSSRQSLVVRALDASGTTELGRRSVQHDAKYPKSGRPASWRSDQQMRDDGYTLVAPGATAKVGLEYIAQASGLVTLELEFTIAPVDGADTSDDIWISTPTVTPAYCAF